jgi:signal transduction histidine kinase
MLLFMMAAPLATIPLFLARGAPASWGIAGPVINAVFCGLGYHLLAMRAVQWRRLRGEQAAEIERLRLREADLERQQLARDLHDSVGSALSLVGMYGDLVERFRHEPEELARIATTLREATHEGLGDLRGVLDAMAPETDDLDALANNLDRIGGRVTSATGIAIVLAVTGERTHLVAPGLSLGVVRLFQEAVHNAVRHGRPSTIHARVAMEPTRLTLEVRDDGDGFDPTKVARGRGLYGMDARTKALGGTLVLVASPARGTSVTVELPRRSPA